jgi:hypothetical protein
MNDRSFCGFFAEASIQEDPLTELTVDAMIEIAGTGDRLCEHVLVRLRRPYQDVA